MRHDPQSDDMVVAATVELVREHGLLDAKELVRGDASILLAAADKAKVGGHLLTEQAAVSRTRCAAW
jgi:hypothetical protein